MGGLVVVVVVEMGGDGDGDGDVMRWLKQGGSDDIIMNTGVGLGELWWVS